MKFSVVFLVAFVVLMVDSQNPDSSKLPIPIINDRAASAIVKASNMLADVYKATIANEDFDKSGALTGIRILLEDVNPLLNTIFVKIAGAVTSRITRNGNPDDPLSELISAVMESFQKLSQLSTNLEGKIKPSEYSDIVDSIKVIVTKTLDLSVFMPQVRLSNNPFMFDEFGALRAVDNNQGLDLEALISTWSTAIEGIANSLQVLAKAIQKVVDVRIQALNVQKSVHRSLSISGSYLSRTSTQLNTALENVRTQLIMFSQTTITQVTQAYYSITSNPTKWHQNVISKTSNFLDTYSGLIRNEYQTTAAVKVKNAELGIAGSVIRQTRRSGLKIADVSIYITDRAAASDNPRASSVCALKQLAKLNPSSLNRLAQCLTIEASNIRAISTQGQQHLTVAKNNAVSSVSQLSSCNSGSDECIQQLTDFFDNKKSRAMQDLTSAGEQLTNTLTTITDRIVFCLEAVTVDIETTAMKAKEDFDFCLMF